MTGPRTTPPGGPFVSGETKTLGASSPLREIKDNLWVIQQELARCDYLGEPPSTAELGRHLANLTLVVIGLVEGIEWRVGR